MLTVIVVLTEPWVLSECFSSCESSQHQLSTDFSDSVSLILSLSMSVSLLGIGETILVMVLSSSSWCLWLSSRTLRRSFMSSNSFWFCWKKRTMNVVETIKWFFKSFCLTVYWVVYLISSLSLSPLSSKTALLMSLTVLPNHRFLRQPSTFTSSNDQ